MPDALWARLPEQLAQLPELECVVFGGMGEPLLDRRLPQLIRTLSQRHIRTELITNGTLLDEKTSESLVAAGLSCLWLSMDGFTEESFAKQRLGARYAQLTGNLERFNAARAESATELGITFVVMRENLDELAHINAFADRYGAAQLNISHVIPATPLPETDAIYDLPIRLGRVRRVFRDDGPRSYDRCPFLEQDAAFLRWDGDVAPCMQLLHNSDTYLYELKRRIYRCSFGSIREQSLLAIWNGEAYRRFRALVREFDFPSCTICMGCDDRLENKTDCMHNSFPTCGACLWSEGIIFCP